ncbi:MAG TPA: CPBP family intramembrane glutamic endopeptidase [Acidobacteriota bacterium]|nr:CPBP family intramembrane glutamic endopeptidase [Acidobacteriota bacterium]
MELPRLSWMVITIGLAIELLIGVAGFAVAWMLNKENLFETLSFGLRADVVALGAALGLAAGLLIWLSVKTIRAFQRSRSMRVLEVLFGATWLQAFLLCAVAACAEEILFRGALQPDLGIWATALLFGLLHAYGKLYIVVAILAGIGLGFLYQLSGSLPAAIAAHAIYNLTILILIKTRLFPIAYEKRSNIGGESETAADAV